MLNLKKKQTIDTTAQDTYRSRFQDSFFAALSEIVFADQLDTAIVLIVSAIERAFDCDTFLFSRNGDTAALNRFSAETPDDIAALIRKAGVRFSSNKIPLTGGRKRIFEVPFAEYDEIFQLLGDVTTSAACRKLQRELRVQFVATASLKAGNSELVLLLLLHQKPSTLRQDLGRFVFLLNAAFHLSSVKGKLRTLEERFDEQVVRVKSELRQKESSHLSLFGEMPIAAAVLDERGVVVEANEALRRLIEDESDPVGQSFSSIVDEEARQEFVEFLVGVDAGEKGLSSVTISERHFKIYVATRRAENGERGLSAVYLADDTSDVELRSELGRTIDTLRAENDSVEKSARETREFSEQVVRNSSVPIVMVEGGKLRLASGAVSGVFEVEEGKTFDDFLAANGLPRPVEGEVSDIRDNKGRIFSVTRWRISGSEFFIFDEVTAYRRLEEDLRIARLESQRLFNSFLPTAAVKDGTISKWNDMFESLFKEFLASDRSFDGLLRYLGESPDGFKSELQSGGVVMRMCRTTDRKYLNVSAAVMEGTTFLFMEDITEQEGLKQQLRAAQGLLSNLLESYAEEPVFIVEGGVVRASNVAARNKLAIRLDEGVEPARVLAGIGIAKPEDAGELNGRFYRVDNISVGSSQVYRFRQISQEVSQRAEIERLKRRQAILKNLAAADRFEAVLQSLGELISADSVAAAKVIGTGTLQAGKGTADVFLMTLATGRIEPSLSLSLTESDVTTVKHGGALSGIEVPDSTLMNVISAGNSRLLIQSTSVGEVMGFASAAVPATGIQSAYIEELSSVLKSAASVAAGLHARISAERKFEDSGKVTRAVVGLTGMGDGTFEEIARKSLDLIRHVFSAESAGVYSIQGTEMNMLVSNGELPQSLSVPAVKFGALIPANQFESTALRNAEGFYFAIKSRPQKLAMLLRFAGASASPSELNAITSVSLDSLEARRSAEEQAKVSDQLVANSKTMSEFMTRLAKASSAEEIAKTLAESLARISNDSSAVLKDSGGKQEAGQPMELVAQEAAGSMSYTADFSNVGLGVLEVKCAADTMSHTMVELAVDKIKGIVGMKVPLIQAESSNLRAKLERSGEEYARLRESVERIPASMRNARIGIDNAISRLGFVNGDEKVMQEIRLHLAAAAKEMSGELDSSSRNQDELFEAVRDALLNPVSSNAGAARIRGFETTSLAEFRTDQATFDLLRDLFSNVVMISGARDCDILMTTSQPAPGELEEGRGKRVGMRLTTGEGVVDEERIEGSPSIRTIVAKLEKLGYGVEADVQGGVMMMEVFESRPVGAGDSGVLSALLVEDDKQLVEEESQNLLQVFPRLKVAGDAVEASKLFNSEKFSVAFIDLSLPSINGRELCSQLKKAQPQCTTVLLTNREGEEKSEGVDNINLRPLEVDAITSYIQK